MKIPAKQPKKSSPRAVTLTLQYWNDVCFGGYQYWPLVSEDFLAKVPDKQSSTSQEIPTHQRGVVRKIWMSPFWWMYLEENASSKWEHNGNIF